MAGDIRARVRITIQKGLLTIGSLLSFLFGLLSPVRMEQQQKDSDENLP